MKIEMGPYHRACNAGCGRSSNSSRGQPPSTRGKPAAGPGRDPFGRGGRYPGRRQRIAGGTTYLLPLRQPRSEVYALEKAQHAVYGEPACPGRRLQGPDAVRNVCYSRSTTPTRSCAGVRAQGQRQALLRRHHPFSANINYNGNGRVYVLNNPNVQFLLDNNEQFCGRCASVA